MALLDKGALIGRSEQRGKGHAERLLAMVDRVLDEAGYALASLDAIAADIGPGAFSGVRLTVAVAQGLAFGAALPVVPVSSLEALALAAFEDGVERALTCLDARMSEVYWGVFSADAKRGLVTIGAPRVGPPGGVRAPDGARYRGVGRGFAVYPALAATVGIDVLARDMQALPNARAIARLGAIRFAAGAGLDPAELAPLYVRDKVALTEAERAP